MTSERPPADLFTVRRVPDVLVEPVRARRAVESVVGLGVLYPEPACLTIRIEGRVVLRSGTGNALIPASVQKLLTAAAVVDTMAPEERLRTVVLTTAPVVDGEISGDLILVGGGDPMLGTEPYADAYSRQPQLRTPIEELAEAIAATGVDHVHGRIIVNDDRYDTARVVATWPRPLPAHSSTQDRSAPLPSTTGLRSGNPSVYTPTIPRSMRGGCSDRNWRALGSRSTGRRVVATSIRQPRCWRASTAHRSGRLCSRCCASRTTTPQSRC